MESLQIGGIAFSFDPLTPNLEKLDPIQGFKKIFALKQLVELIKSIMKILIIVGIILSVLKNELF